MPTIASMLWMQPFSILSYRYFHSLLEKTGEPALRIVTVNLAIYDTYYNITVLKNK